MATPLAITTDLSHRGVGHPEALDLPPDTFGHFGGREAVAQLVDGLYDRIERDAYLRGAFARTLDREKEAQKQFFEAWLGGSQGYFEADWMPGLRARHYHLFLSPGIAERWLTHVSASLAEIPTDPALKSAIESRTRHLAAMMVNRDEEPRPDQHLRCCGTGRDALPFLNAVRRDDAATLDRLAAEAPSFIPAHGASQLLIASLRGKANSAEALIRHGAPVNTPTILPGSQASTHRFPQLPITPLCAALAKRRFPVVQILHNHDAKYDIFTAAFLGDLSAVETALAQDPRLADAADPACDVARITPLVHAVAMGRLEVGQLLFAHGATVRGSGLRMLRLAANRGDLPLTALLLDHGVDPAPIGPGEWVTFPEVADRLVTRGADVNRPPWAWIHMSCTGNSGHKERPDLVAALLRCGADVQARYNGRTALHHLARAGFARAAELVLEAGADVNALSDSGRTSLEEVDFAAPSIDRQAIRRVLASWEYRS